ncbi:MAG: hypothetical protein KBA97_05125 [Methanothrix sp.]|nr:hypothetical protein [Methanothrix sp.]
MITIQKIMNIIKIVYIVPILPLILLAFYLKVEKPFARENLKILKEYLTAIASGAEKKIPLIASNNLHK